MSKPLPFLIFSLLVALSAAFAAAAQDTNQQLFDNGWKFRRGASLTAGTVAFDDAAWRRLDLPHDWSVEDLPGTTSPLSKAATSQVSTGYRVGGTGWYRKHFAVPQAQQGKVATIRFDGVYMNADVWVNGQHLGHHPYGYTSFVYDLTPHLKYGGDNVIAVEVKNEGRNSRWYSGSGIYRHVWLTFSNPLRLDQWGVKVTTPEVTAAAAKVVVAARLVNGTKQAATALVKVTVLDSAGRQVAAASSPLALAAGEAAAVSQPLTVPAPALWSLQSPRLYTALVQVVQENQQTVDEQRIPFGIRSITYDAANGLRLNGQVVELRGGCVHNDNGLLGARAYDRAEERKVQLLRANGYNAIRCAHNPPSPALLDACDRLGMLVIDEAFDEWQDAKTAFGYHLYFDNWWQKDLRSMILRDQNHPSVFVWSIGNEILNMGDSAVAKTCARLANYARTLDPSRPVTAAVNFVEDKYDPFMASLDIVGYNYSRYGYVKDHAQHPARVMMATESYPLDAKQYWGDVEQYPWLIGDFVWTSFDYLGEASIGWLGGINMDGDSYPWNLAFTADLDICGDKRPQSYYRDALWAKNQVSLFVQAPVPSYALPQHKYDWSRWEWHDVWRDWNWPNYVGKTMQVEAYSSCQEVELFANDKSLGRQRTDSARSYTARWKVPYHPGALRAVGYSNGKKAGQDQLATAGPPAALRATADRLSLRADNQDLSYVTVSVRDGQGRLHPKADNALTFAIAGPATIVGVGNANPVSTESFQALTHRAWQGKCLVVVKAGKASGPIKLTVSAPGLKPAQVLLQAQ